MIKSPRCVLSASEGVAYKIERNVEPHSGAIHGIKRSRRLLSPFYNRRLCAESPARSALRTQVVVRGKLSQMTEVLRALIRYAGHSRVQRGSRRWYEMVLCKGSHSTGLLHKVKAFRS